MAITYQPAGYGEYVEQKASAAGQAAAAIREQEFANRAQELALQIEERQAAAQLDFKMKQDLAQIEYQMDLEKFARAKAWDIEKMELTSKLDFQKEESERIRKEEQFKLDIEAIDKAHDDGTIDDDEWAKTKKARFLKFHGLDEAVKSLYSPTLEQLIAAEEGKTGKGKYPLAPYNNKGPTTSKPGQLAGINVPTVAAMMYTDKGKFVLTDIGPIQIFEGQTYRGVGPDGKSAPIPADKVDVFVNAGGLIVPTPTAIEINVTTNMQTYLDQIPGIIEKATGKPFKVAEEEVGTDIHMNWEPQQRTVNRFGPFAFGEAAPGIPNLTEEEKSLYLNYNYGQR